MHYICFSGTVISDANISNFHLSIAQTNSHNQINSESRTLKESEFGGIFPHSESIGLHDTLV